MQVSVACGAPYPDCSRNVRCDMAVHIEKVRTQTLTCELTKTPGIMEAMCGD